MALASDLRWLINEGYVIEFNDGSLDLPRAKTKSVEAAVSAAKEETIVANVPAAEKKERVEANASPARTAPPASESVEAPKESKSVVAAVVSTAENSKVREEVAQEIGTEVGAIDPIARGRFGEPPLPESEVEIGGS